MRKATYILSLLFWLGFAVASDYDDGVANSLNLEANHNLNRLKSYKNEAADNKIYEKEREKGLGEYLEEQERWDLIRERGLQNYRKQKKSNTPTEGSTEYKQYLKDKLKAERQYKKSQQTYVKTRDKIRAKQTQTIAQLESEELQLGVIRPRYESAKRSRNQWLVGSGAKSGTPGATTNSPPLSGFPNNNSSPISDYPSEFPAVPAPYDGYDDSLPSPIFDGSNGIPYDPSFGGDLSIPPPPPPPPDFDF